MSNVEIGSTVAYDLTSNLRPDILLLGNGGTTDLPFYISPSEEGPSVVLSNPLNTLNPYTRSQVVQKELLIYVTGFQKNIILRIQL